MLDESDLEINVLEFRQRSFQFERLVEHNGREYAIFARTETESESQFRPRLLHLRVIVPRAWVMYDEPNDVLVLARDGMTLPLRVVESVTEVGADPPEFREQGLDWRRVPGPNGLLVYLPEEFEEALLSPGVLGQLLGP